MYRSVVRPLLFSLDPETAHNLTMALSGPFGARLLSPLMHRFFGHADPRLEVKLWNRAFPNPIGLAAGLDKNGSAIGLWNALGFGSVEIGSVTHLPQPGNPRPRIFRFAGEEALINRMGFPSIGASAVAHHLARYRQHNHSVIVGVNIGKSKLIEIDAALDDYLKSFEILQPFADYVTINVSSPNTPDLRRLQEPSRLRALFQGIQQRNARGLALLVKIAPDLSFEELDEILGVCAECSVGGIIATNTTISRSGLRTPTSEVGGLSGAPLRSRALEVVRYVYARTDGRLPIVGVGGIRSAADLLAMVGAGATLVQLYTALIYSGPMLVNSILRDLSEFLSKNQLPSIQDLVGKEKDLSQMLR